MEYIIMKMNENASLLVHLWTQQGQLPPLDTTHTNALVVNLFLSCVQVLAGDFVKHLEVRIACGEANASGDINLLDRGPLETPCSQARLILQEKILYFLLLFSVLSKAQQNYNSIPVSIYRCGYRYKHRYRYGKQKVSVILFLINWVLFYSFEF